MNDQATEKPMKQKAQQSNRMVFRISKETGKKVLGLLSKINKKDFGKKVKMDHLILELLSFASDAVVEKLRQNSLTNHDKLEMKFKEYASKKPGMSKDEFVGLIPEGKLSIQ